MPKLSEISAGTWLEIESRIYSGEPIREVAKAYGAPYSTVRHRCGHLRKQSKIVVDQLVAAEREVEKLPVVAQAAVRTMAKKMLAMSNDLMQAAAYGAENSARLGKMAVKFGRKAEKAPKDEMYVLAGNSAAFQKMSNLAAEIPLELMKVHKETSQGVVNDEMKKPNGPTPKDLTDAELAAELARYGVE